MTRLPLPETAQGSESILEIDQPSPTPNGPWEMVVEIEITDEAVTE